LAEHHRKRLKIFGRADQQRRERVQFYEEEARDFHRAATEAREWASAANRQGGGARFTREHLSFMRELVASMRRNFRKPYYEATAAIANIAYPRKGVTAEEVRTVYRRPPPDRTPVRYQEPLYEATGKTFEEGLELLRREKTGKLDKK
jgi:hypothetical protein